MRVVIADDSFLIRTGVAEVLRRGRIDVVGEVGDAVELMRSVDELRPDAVVVDIRMPPGQSDEGLVAARAIRSGYPGTAVLVLSMHVQSTWALRLLQGQPESLGYLLKDRVAEGALLIDALRRVVDGETVIDPTIVARLLGRRRSRDPLAALTARELEILGLMAEGRSNAGIAGHLVLSERTVETHVTSILAKLDLSADVGHRRVLAVLAYLSGG